MRTSGLDAGDIARLRGGGRLHGEHRAALGAIDGYVDGGVVHAGVVEGALDARQRHALAGARPVALGSELQRTLLHGLRELRGLGDRIDQPPIERLLAAHALGGGAEDVGQVVAHAALVGDARQATGAGQYAEQRHLGQRHRRRAVVDQHDVVARQRQLVAAAGAGAVQRGDELQPRVARRILDAIARLVGELAEVDLPRMRREAQHEDVGAGAEDALLGRRDDHRAHLGVLEAHAVQRIVQLDVDAEVIAVELELVAGLQAAVFGHVHRQRGDLSIEAQLPVFVARGLGTVVDDGVIHGRGSLTSTILQFIDRMNAS